ncbi:MAG: cytidine deaminase [Methanoregulaceae archaeon]|nr:cytidine deaminase [Methanoregulaceae archaeon]
MTLIEAAVHVRRRAYAPYSGYAVGSAILDDRGLVHVGCNVENISYGGCICAERSAAVRMVAEGGRRICEVAVATVDGGAPCGICLQFLAEFTDGDVLVHLVDESGTVESLRFDELLPHGFSSEAVSRTDRP